MTSVDAPEIEWQFDALDLRPVVRWLSDPAGWDDLAPVRVVPRKSDNHVDLYLDTDDRRFHRAGFALRIRRPTRGNGRGEATLKALDGHAADGSGLRARREVSETLEQPDPAALAQAPGAVGERVRAVAGPQPLRSYPRCS